MEHLRKCAGCGQIFDREKMIKITYSKDKNEIFINPDSKKFGRSVYLCYNKMCIENALKKNKIQKALKTTISEELKGKLIEFE